MRYLVCTVVACWLSFQARSQSKNGSIQLAGGVGENTNYDQLINNYSYTGISALVQITGELSKDMNHFEVHVMTYGNQAESNSNSILYEYNDSQLRIYALRLLYLRDIQISSPKFKLAWGVGNRTQLTTQQQYYKNVLYAAAEGYRKSYCLSLANLESHLQSVYALNPKNSLKFSASYSFLSYAARPTDNYVKQLHLDATPQWEPYLGKEYYAYEVALLYMRSLGSSLSFTIEAKTSYQYYDSEDTYINLLNTILVGLTKHF